MRKWAGVYKTRVHTQLVAQLVATVKVSNYGDTRIGAGIQSIYDVSSKNLSRFLVNIEEKILSVSVVGIGVVTILKYSKESYSS